jgi:hypothetical protein
VRSAEPDSDRMWSLTSWSLKWDGFGLIYDARLVTVPDSPNPLRFEEARFSGRKAIFVRRGGP